MQWFKNGLNGLLRWIYYRLIIRSIIGLVLGLNIRRRQLIPNQGPVILVANHNSHLDTMVLMTLLSNAQLKRAKPVAAMDYFLKNRLLAWFALKIVGILPISRHREADQDPLAPCYEALERGDILIFFPEGSRGEPEKRCQFKGGIAKLAARYPDIPVVPIFLHGLGKALPKGDWLLVPFFCDGFIGEPLFGQDDRHAFMDALEQRFYQLEQEGHFQQWD
ncbi:hypothetical protein VST7929_00287 [Vibrio stylophorae]|uniref:Phospholipid/glycerol acyltransferase domain-containing protein n=1 Tax=Vibrio stylophorae TaxID=659351 RepID=A0ABM8ZQV4_9VIBR|nr:lysophospholipid acyltransferase family protein [Vibrio stylophorae]CAH0532458.1 hypothetical protein VST7929_00287 [Vibrio stylophorae]